MVPLTWLHSSAVHPRKASHLHLISHQNSSQRSALLAKQQISFSFLYSVHISISQKLWVFPVMRRTACPDTIRGDKHGQCGARNLIVAMPVWPRHHWQLVFRTRVSSLFVVYSGEADRFDFFFFFACTRYTTYPHILIRLVPQYLFQSWNHTLDRVHFKIVNSNFLWTGTSLFFYYYFLNILNSVYFWRSTPFVQEESNKIKSTKKIYEPLCEILKVDPTIVEIPRRSWILALTFNWSPSIVI